ncbi:hypothetical protein OPT61_g8149 [Boeremia exigua]|uniref:Uncharacterized protein n=1 Tax=Boeremia exigua TaxID=749465 RepID=A0ACC2I0D4_9PLEO|nr:hypothetical protein OPT61_g8149 [Boeremia exigua]
MVLVRAEELGTICSFSDVGRRSGSESLTVRGKADGGCKMSVTVGPDLGLVLVWLSGSASRSKGQQRPTYAGRGQRLSPPSLESLFAEAMHLNPAMFRSGECGGAQG